MREDKRRIIKGKQFQIVVFDSAYIPDIYDVNAENEDAEHHLLARIESDHPFMAIHEGDFLDGRTLGFDLAVLFRVERVEHQIGQFHEPVKHRIFLFVKRHDRMQPSDTD